jgi:uncharacterized surface protein with fasciclin (FAS1) repeats
MGISETRKQKSVREVTNANVIKIAYHASNAKPRLLIYPPVFLSGTLKNIMKTLTEVGGKEFTRLVRNVGLDSKLEEENLTVFVPTDDALATYMNSKRIDI